MDWHLETFSAPSQKIRGYRGSLNCSHITSCHQFRVRVHFNFSSQSSSIFTACYTSYIHSILYIYIPIPYIYTLVTFILYILENCMSRRFASFGTSWALISSAAQCCLQHCSTPILSIYHQIVLTEEIPNMSKYMWD